MATRSVYWITGVAVVVIAAATVWWNGIGWTTPDPANNEFARSLAPDISRNTPRDPSPAAGTNASQAERAIPIQPEASPEVETPPGEHDEPTIDPAEAARNLEGLLEKILKDPFVENPAGKVTEIYLALQELGQPGIEAAARLVYWFEKRWRLGSGDSSTVMDEWGSVASYMKLFSRELILYMVAVRGDYNVEVCSMVLLQNIQHKPEWEKSERVKLAASLLLAAEEGEIPEYRRMAAVQALIHLPCPEAATAAAKFLESGAAPGAARYDAVWVLARVGRDQDFHVIRWVELNDPEPAVRETAEYHRFARGVTEPGFLVRSIDPTGTAVTTLLKQGDIVRWEKEVTFKFAAEVPESFDKDQALKATRQGQPFDVVLPKGVHGLKLSRVPPAFPN